MKPIVLASASPRRRELLEKIGFKFSVDPSRAPENIDTRKEPQETAMSLSRAKAQEVAPRHPGSLIIAADTFGVFQGQIIGKPGDANDAREMLQQLNGRMHLVITGFTVLDTETGKIISRAVTTKVYFRELTMAEIEAYVRTGEPLDKAGAYAIQGLGAVIVKGIEGDYYNVIGLPLSALVECLKEFGIVVLQ